MKRIFFFFLLSIPLVFASCLESLKSDSLSKEITDLKKELASLEREEVDYYKERDRDLVIFNDTVKEGEGLYQVLARLQVNEADRRQVVLAIEDSVELSNLRVGQVFHVAKNQKGLVEVFRYEENPATIHLLFRDPKNREFYYRRVDKPLTIRQSIFEGTIEAGSTLHGTLIGVGVPVRMSGIVAGVLQCKIPFSRVRQGDRFRIMLEESFYQDSIWISGKVVYAEFDGKTVGHYEAFRYEDPDPKSTFNAHYTESGEALIFNGLRYPLDRLHITSPFGWRIHPITGVRKLHKGVDYGSPMGSLVHAVAEGKVIVSGYDEFSGNKIAIRHADKSTSWYLHLSKRGVGVGMKVNAGQVIGRVGSTGSSTGPHLHLGFTNAQGKWIDPRSKTMIATPKLEGERLARLRTQIKFIREEIRKTEAKSPKKIEGSNVKVKMRIINNKVAAK